MNKHINRDMVYWMLATGWHPRRIAQRLDASRRQVDRIARANGWSGTYHLDSFAGEHELWAFYRALGEGPAKIGLRFGRSRQAVHHFFNSNTNQIKKAS